MQLSCSAPIDPFCRTVACSLPEIGVIMCTQSHMPGQIGQRNSMRHMQHSSGIDWSGQHRELINNKVVADLYSIWRPTCTVSSCLDQIYFPTHCHRVYCSLAAAHYYQYSSIPLCIDVCLYYYIIAHPHTYRYRPNRPFGCRRLTPASRTEKKSISHFHAGLVCVRQTRSARAHAHA